MVDVRKVAGDTLEYYKVVHFSAIYSLFYIIWLQAVMCKLISNLVNSLNQS